MFTETLEHQAQYPLPNNVSGTYLGDQDFDGETTMVFLSPVKGHGHDTFKLHFLPRVVTYRKNGRIESERERTMKTSGEEILAKAAANTIIAFLGGSRRKR